MDATAWPLGSETRFNRRSGVLLNHLALVVGSALLLLLLHTAVLAQMTPPTSLESDWKQDAPAIRVGVDPDYAPYSFVDRSGAFRGLAVEILEEISTKSGLEFQYVPGLNWAEIIDGARKRNIDLVATMFQTDSRSEYLNFTEIYIPTPLVIMTRKGDDRVIEPSDLNGKVVALVSQYASTEKVLSDHEAVIPKFVATPAEGLKAVAGSEADAYVGVLGVSTYIARQLGLANLRVTARYSDAYEGLRIAVRSDWPELGQILQNAIRELDPVFLDSVFEKWVPVLHDPFVTRRTIPFQPTELETSWLASKDEIRIGTMSDWPPMDFVDDAGNPRGIGADFIRAMNRRLDGKLKIVPGKWTQIVEDTLAGRLDGVSGITPTQERSELFDFTTPYIVVPHTIFAPDDASFIDDVSQLRGKRVAVERGFFVADALREPSKVIDVVEFENTRAALGAVLRGEADAYIGNRAVAIHTIQTELISGIKAHGTFLETDSTNAFATAKSNGPLVGILEKALNSLSIRERELIFREWVAPDTFDGRPFVLSPEEKEWLVDHPVIRVAGDRSWPPVEFIGSTGEYEGISVDMLNVLSTMLGVRFEFDRTVDWETAAEKVEARELDMFSAAAPTPSRQQYADFTSPYASLPAVIFSRRSDPVGPTLEELSGLRVAAVQGYAVSEFLSESTTDLTLVEVAEVENGLTRLIEGDVDAYIGSILVTGYMIRQMGLTNIVVSGETPYSINISMAVRNDWPEFVRILRRALAQISDQQRSEIRARWLSTEFKEPPNYRLMLILSIIAASVLLFGAMWIWYLRGQAVSLVTDLGEKNAALSREVSERIAAERRANVASKAKSDFLANISHEFRTPLNAIIGYSQLIRLNLRSEGMQDKVSDYTDDLNVASSQLLSLVDDTLDLSVIEEDTFELNQSEFSLPALMAEVKAVVAPMADARRIELAWPAGLDVQFVADQDRLRQVFANLLDNAIKYNHEGGKVAVTSAEMENGNLHIVVQDSGIGMSQTTIDRIFHPFSRGDDPFTRSSKGVGLGLAICDRLVQMHGGRIDVDSEIDKGTTITVVLPKERWSVNSSKA